MQQTEDGRLRALLDAGIAVSSESMPGGSFDTRRTASAGERIEHEANYSAAGR